MKHVKIQCHHRGGSLGHLSWCLETPTPKVGTVRGGTVISSPARPCLYSPLDLSLLQSSQYLGDEVEQKGWQETHDFHAFTHCARRASWALTQLISLQAEHSWCYTPVVQIRKLRHREVDIQAGKWWNWVSRCAVAVKRPT